MSQRIEQIPVGEIRIVNPRSRNGVTFQGIVANMENVGLKRPITVYARDVEDDGTRYDLICGQGRLESVRAIGDATIPAIIRDVPKEDRYLMSLVENLARKQPSPTAILREVKRLKALHCEPAVIAQKLGLKKGYVYGVIRLLRQGEDDLIARVERGRLSMDLAIKIATADDPELQRALSAGYEDGSLRGAKLNAIQRLIAKRKGNHSSAEGPRQFLTSKDLVREYERQTHQQRALVRRAVVIHQRLLLLLSSFKPLLADENFLTLLRAEGLGKYPAHLAPR
jgi:ParB family transcriptional regulator, chromosome partitioning protein